MTRTVTILFAIVLLVATPCLAVDFHVALTGSDSPGNGLTPENPFRSISYALTVADTTANRPHTIHIAAGTYSRATELYPLPMIDQVTLRGAGPGLTILHGGNQQSNLITAVGAVGWIVEELSLTGGRSLQGGAILAAQGGPMTLRNLHIHGNRADHPSIPNFEGHGGGVYIFSVANATLDHILFHDNSARDTGGAITIIQSAATLNHVTVTRNTCDVDNNSSAIFLSGGAQDMVTLTNSIVWGNGNEAGEHTSMSAAPVTVSYSIVERDVTTPWPGDGNANRDPLFVDPQTLFTLLEGSPAIDRANPTAPYANEPGENGGRANAGYYGNTANAQVSLSSRLLRFAQWAMIGVPVDPPTGDPQELFGDDFAGETPGANSWRLQRWDPVERVMLRYDEPDVGGVDLGDPPPVEPGLGYMIRQRLVPTATLDVPGMALDTRDPLVITLPIQNRTSLHTVANPHPFSTNWQDARISTPGGLISFDQAAAQGIASRYLYVMDGRGALIPTLGSLLPWQGAVAVTLDNRAQAIQFSSERTTPSSGTLFEGLEWGLLVGAAGIDESGETMGRDSGHLFGVGPSMQNGIDPWDARLIDWNTVHFDLRFIEQNRDPLFHDLRAPIANGTVREWRAVFTSRLLEDNPGLILADSVEITIEGFRSILEDGYIYPPEEYNFWLLDKNYEILIEDLRDTAMVRLPLEEVSETERQFKFWIFAGNNSTSVEPRAEEAAQPSGFALLDVYPNPFNATTTLRYRVSQPGEVRLRLFDLLGRQVLADSWQVSSAGQQLRSLDASTLASGTYFLRLEAEGLSNVRRVSLVK